MLSYDKIVRLQCKDNMLKCIIEKEHLYKERSFAVKKDVSFDFLINPVFLKQILNRGSTFYINEEKHKMYFISKNFSHVLSLCIG